MVERDVIGHLMDVERQALDLVLEATKEADKRKAIARERADREYTAAYASLIASLESRLEDGKKACDARRDKEYADWSAYLASLPRDTRAFDALVDSILGEQ